MKTKSLFDAEGALEAPPAGLLDVILHSPYVAVDVETKRKIRDAQDVSALD